MILITFVFSTDVSWKTECQKRWLSLCRRRAIWPLSAFTPQRKRVSTVWKGPSRAIIHQLPTKDSQENMMVVSTQHENHIYYQPLISSVYKLNTNMLEAYLWKTFKYNNCDASVLYCFILYLVVLPQWTCKSVKIFTCNTNTLFLYKKNNHVLNHCIIHNIN